MAVSNHGTMIGQAALAVPWHRSKILGENLMEIPQLMSKLDKHTVVCPIDVQSTLLPYWHSHTFHNQLSDAGKETISNSKCLGLCHGEAIVFVFDYREVS